MSITDPRKTVVAAGYDVVAERYLEWTGGAPVRNHYLQQFYDLVPVGGRVLDLGCGAGVPVAKKLAERASVVGVDISAAQVALARQKVPEASFINADMMAVEFPPEFFDGISAFFSLTHLPREEHAAMLRRIAVWLRPGGVFVASMGDTVSNDEIENDWLGAAMFFSHFDAATNSQLIRVAGLQPFHEEVVEHIEDECIVRFLWVMTRKNA
jgi:cyclopropane fatty-acyl-phospholipid synthase-like methyltransferase